MSDKNKEGMMLLETGVETEGSFALFASVLSLPSVTCCSVTADMAIWMSSIWYRFRERSTFEAKRKARILSSAANFTSLVSFQQPFYHCSLELKLSNTVSSQLIFLLSSSKLAAISTLCSPVSVCTLVNHINS